MPSQIVPPRQHDFFGPPLSCVDKLVREQPVEPIRRTARAFFVVHSLPGTAVDLPLGCRPIKAAG